MKTRKIFLLSSRGREKAKCGKGLRKLEKKINSGEVRFKKDVY
jgi:hypothetical protein